MVPNLCVACGTTPPANVLRKSAIARSPFVQLCTGSHYVRSVLLLFSVSLLFTVRLLLAVGLLLPVRILLWRLLVLGLSFWFLLRFRFFLVRRLRFFFRLRLRRRRLGFGLGRFWFSWFAFIGRRLSSFATAAAESEYQHSRDQACQQFLHGCTCPFACCPGILQTRYPGRVCASID
jgi:hypothetical protein